MKWLFIWVAGLERNRVRRFLHRAVRFIYFALENKNNDHHANGEFWLQRQIQQIAPKVVFDVGANVGSWSLSASSIFVEASIFSFEPIPQIFKNLENNTSDVSRISVFNIGLGDSPGKVQFNFYPGAKLFNTMYSHHRGGNAILVDCIVERGEVFCGDRSIDQIDFLKIDVEGAEHLVLKGFSSMISSGRIRAIQFEYGTVSIESKFLLKDYFNFFQQHGYKVGKIYPSFVEFRPYHWEMENFIGPNFLAIRVDDEALTKLVDR